MKFKKQFMQDLAETLLNRTWEVEGGLVVTKISDEFVDKSRWSDIHEMIFKVGDQFFQSSYRIGSTECCEESPYEYDGDEIECEEVVPVEKTVIVYVTKKAD